MEETQMEDEIFDVVDENDNVIGQRPRAEVHRLNLLHRSVHVLVFNTSGAIFLQKRSMAKDCNPGVWDASVSGHLNAGEDYATCARRETAEEIGLELDGVPEYLFKLPADPDTAYEFSCVYRTIADGPFELQYSEIDRGEWFAPDRVSAWMQQRPEDFAGPLRVLWRRLYPEPSGQ